MGRTLYYVQRNFGQPGGQTTPNWDDTKNWSLSSGGLIGEPIPTKDDDVIFDINSISHFNTPFSNQVTINVIAQCHNLTMIPGAKFKVNWTNQDASALYIFGNLVLQGSASIDSGDTTFFPGTGPLRLNPSTTNNYRMHLLGECVFVGNVIAQHIHSWGGKRIVYQPSVPGGEIEVWDPEFAYSVGDVISFTDPFSLEFIGNFVALDNHTSIDFYFDQAYGHWALLPYTTPQSLPGQLSVGNSFASTGSGLDIFPCTIINCPFWVNHFPINRHIQTPNDLQNMDQNPNDNYVMDNDIDLGGFSWTPICYSGETHTNHFSLMNGFTGSFNGQGHVIKNLVFTDPNPFTCAGLFGFAGSALVSLGNPWNGAWMSPQIENVTLTNFNLSGGYAVGALVGFIQAAQIVNIHVRNIQITATGGFASSIGGLGGDCFGFPNIPTTITNCDVKGLNLLVPQASSGSNFGGLLGDCFIQLDVSHFKITNCSAQDINISALDSADIGGLFGIGVATVFKCFTTGNITLGNFQVGGLIGEVSQNDQGNLISCIITNCYSQVNVTGDADSSSNIGGFIGEIDSNHTTIINCYCSGTVTAPSTSSLVGGFTGQIDGLTSPLIITNCYSAGLVTCAGSNVGGFVGAINLSSSSEIVATNIYWWTGSFSTAIGFDSTSSVVINDESDNTKFYSTIHPVYAQT